MLIEVLTSMGDIYGFLKIKECYSNLTYHSLIHQKSINYEIC
jgi:hypothetical protein